MEETVLQALAITLQLLQHHFSKKASAAGEFFVVVVRQSVIFLIGKRYITL